MAENENSLESVLDELLKVLKRAVKQSKDTTLKLKKKIVSTEYDEELKKPMQEITEENEEITQLKGMVDINSLKLLTGLLKEVHQMKGEDVDSEESQKGIIVLADIKDLDKDEQ